MGVFTDEELEFLATQHLARLATASASGVPDVSPVGFGVDGDSIISGGLDITKTVRTQSARHHPICSPTHRPRSSSTTSRRCTRGPHGT